MHIPDPRIFELQTDHLFLKIDQRERGADQLIAERLRILMLSLQPEKYFPCSRQYLQSLQPGTGIQLGDSLNTIDKTSISQAKPFVIGVIRVQVFCMEQFDEFATAESFCYIIHSILLKIDKNKSNH